MTDLELAREWLDAYMRDMGMTRQQAGVSAEAVAKLVAKWREEGEMDTSIGSLGIPTLLRAADELESALRQEDQARKRIEQLEVQLAGCMTAATGWAKDPPKKGDWGWSPAFQDVLDLRNKYEALLATAPPEQAALPAKLTLDDIVTALNYASEGRKWAGGGIKPDLLGNQLNRVLARLADEVPIIHGQAELAAHDQKVRAETLEEAAQVIDQCNREGPYNAIQGASRIRALAAPAQAASKPEAGKGTDDA